MEPAGSVRPTLPATPSPMNPERYEYATIPAEVMFDATVVPLEPDSYVSRGRNADRVEALLEAGFRWVRTDEVGHGAHAMRIAVLERKVATP